MTIGFCSLSTATAAALALYDPAALQQQFCGVVRATLSACEGYECQEKAGIFMLAFHDMRKAVEWGLTLQLALLQVRSQSSNPPSLPIYEPLASPSSWRCCRCAQSPSVPDS